MPNTKPIGVAYSDPAFDSVTVSGAVTAATVTATTITGNLVGNVTGSVTGMFTIPSATVAAAGSSQSNAAAVATGFTLVSASDDTKGVKLPAAAAGLVCIIKNNVSAKTLKIYPNTDDAVNAVAANSSFDIAGLTSCVLVAYDATTWYSVPLVAS
jgi:hypothetical protein